MFSLKSIRWIELFTVKLQPSLNRVRVLALAQLDFIARAEVVHFLGPSGTGKSHLATALSVAAVKAGRSVYRCSLAELIEALSRPPVLQDEDAEDALTTTRALMRPR